MKKTILTDKATQDFSDLEKMRTDLKTNVLVSALGTTIKKAGSRDDFRRPQPPGL